MLKRVKAEAVGLLEPQVCLLIQPLGSPTDVCLPFVFTEHYEGALPSLLSLLFPEHLLTTNYVPGTVPRRP